MCKLLIMTGITEGLVAQEFMRRMAVPMSRTNSHGIGYTAVGPDGELFSQRWLNNDHFFDTRDVMTPEIAETLQPYAHRLPKGALDNNYSEMGTIDFENVKTVTMHTRFATCGREFANTHPFIYEDTSLIHNGTIRNAFSSHYNSYSSKGLDVNKISTCDSEAALQTYLSQGVNLDIKQAKSWIDLLSGSWAFGILTRNQQGNRVLDVVRGTSSLYYMEIDGLGKVFTTDDDDAKAVVKDMGLTFVTAPYLLAMDEMYRYDTVTGGMLEKGNIKTVYNSGSGNSYSKTRGRSSTENTGATGTSNSPSTKTSTTQSTGSNKPGTNLLAMVDSLRDEPDFMSCFPDIFTQNSTKTNLHLDFRKVTKHVNDLQIPLIDRLDIFDLVYNSTFRTMYEAFPTELREYVRQVDNREGLKAARKIIKEVYEKRNQSVVG